MTEPSIYMRWRRACVLCERKQDWQIRLNGHNRCGQCAKLAQRLARIGRRKGVEAMQLEAGPLIDLAAPEFMGNGQLRLRDGALRAHMADQDRRIAEREAAARAHDAYSQLLKRASAGR